MKKTGMRRYGQFFRRHFFMMIIVWMILCYVFLQSAYLILFSKIEQKTTVNFYEGMETIQHVTKDKAFADAEMEIKYTLFGMSDAGSYNLNQWLTGYRGRILGLRLEDWMVHFLEFGGGHSYDGDGNTFLGGFGKGWGFVLDAETEEIVCEAGWDSNKNAILYLCDSEDKPYENSVTFYMDYVNAKYCPYEELTSVIETLADGKKKWQEYYQDHDSDGIPRAFTWRMEEVYLKHDQFYPAKVSLYRIDGRPNTEVRGDDRRPDELVDTKSFQPADMTGYQLYKIDPEKETATAMFLNSVPGDVNYVTSDTWEPDEAFKKEALETIKDARIKSNSKDMGKGWSVGNPLLYFINGEMVFVRSAYFQDAEGHVYKACTYQTISELFQGNRYTIVWWMIWLAILLTLIAVITSYVHYLKRRQVFMTKEYRDVLMDSMAHDLKSPLMAVSGYADSLREHVNDEKRDHYAEQIQKSVKYMNEIVMKNLEILKYDKEHKRCVRKDVNLRKLFEEALDRYQDEVEANQLKISREGELTAKGDEELLQKVAENLMTNCIRYTPKGGSILIHFDKRGFSVQNETEMEYSGSLKHLWEPFVRGEESRTGKGTGLGLAIVANVLDRHSWKYKLNYDKEKKTFICTVKIPVGILF